MTQDQRLQVLQQDMELQSLMMVAVEQYINWYCLMVTILMKRLSEVLGGTG